jgi:hypothetical protein
MEKPMKQTLLAVTLSGLFALTSFGQVNKRAENQQDRIAQGVKSGTLSAGQTARLETREARVNREVRRDRRVNDGHLTATEKQHINRQQNRISRSIRRDKTH